MSFAQHLGKRDILTADTDWNGSKSAILVTSWFHSRRAVKRFRFVMPQIQWISFLRNEPCRCGGLPSTATGCRCSRNTPKRSSTTSEAVSCGIFLRFRRGSPHEHASGFCLFGGVILLICWGMMRRERIYEFPFLTGVITFSFILPQVPGLASERFLPEGAFARTAIFMMLCLFMCWWGGAERQNPLHSFVSISMKHVC